MKEGICLVKKEKVVFAVNVDLPGRIAFNNLGGET